MNETNSSVFVVDDDASIRDAIKTLLKSVGLNAQVFESTDQFLGASLPDSPCCLVLDVRLPGTNGLDFQEFLERAGIRIPIIFITAHGDIPMTLRAMKGGAVEFLAREIESLRVLINQLRKKIEPDPANPKYIHTESRIGYRFEPAHFRPKRKSRAAPQ